MKRSTERILVTHAGSLPRPDDLRAMVAAKMAGQPYDPAVLAHRVTGSVADTVRLQTASGVDIVNDGELSKSNFLFYVHERLVGRENIMAGTDWGLGERVGHPSLVWAKFRSMAEGARLATEQLWGKSA